MRGAGARWVPNSDPKKSETATCAWAGGAAAPAKISIVASARTKPARLSRERDAGREGRLKAGMAASLTDFGFSRESGQRR